MRVIETVREMHAARAPLDGPVSMMATLGGMHSGHEALLSVARERGTRLVASLFLNPTQFDDAADLDRYPQDRAADLETFRAHGVDVVFMPSVTEMYPTGAATRVDPGPIGGILEGASRPGHFAGVATVVTKLLSVIRPDVAVWGAKDAQQNAVIGRVSRDLGIGVEHVVVPTVRDHDGLALSSRNQRLSPEERKAAPVLFRALLEARRLFAVGEVDVPKLLDVIHRVVEQESLVRLDYAHIADPETLAAVDSAAADSVVLVAAFVGQTRLIDNVVLASPGD